MPTPEEWESWKSQPVTRELFELLRKDRADLMENWANGNYVNDQEFGTRMLSAQAIGACKYIQDLLEMTELRFKNDEE